MTNGDRGLGLAAEVMRSIATEYGWPDFKPTLRNVVTDDPAILPHYEGTYALTPDFDFVFKVEGGSWLSILDTESRRCFMLNPKRIVSH
jgi:hypothetical protein